MAIYHYQNSPLIERIEVRSLRHGIAQASIITKDLGDAALKHLRLQLAQHKMSTLLDSIDGHPVIQVRGIKDEKKLLHIIAALDSDKHTVHKDELIEDKKPEPTFGERVRSKALFLSSIFYDLGNIAYIISGIQRGMHNPDGKFTSSDYSETATGVVFGLGDILMTAYGHDRGDEELAAAEIGLKKHLHKKGIVIPTGEGLNPDSFYASGGFKAADRWLRAHIGQIKCLAEFAGGILTIKSALKPKNFNQGKLIAGLLIVTGWASTFLLDKPRGHSVFEGDKQVPHGFVESAKDNPRGYIAAPLAMGNNVSNLWGALNPINGERKRFLDDVKNARTPSELRWAQNKQLDFVWNVFSACSFLIAHSLFGLSGKKQKAQTDDDKSIMDDLVLLSANTLNKQPEKVTDIVLKETADYISTLSHVTLDKDQIEIALRTKINDLVSLKSTAPETLPQPDTVKPPAKQTWGNRVQLPLSEPAPALG